MTDCPLCKIVKGELKALVAFEDEKHMAIVHPLPAQRGHLIVFEKEHKHIIGEIEDESLAKMYTIAQSLTSVVFDAFGAQGTNVIIQNGELAGQTLNHFCIHVVPRKEGDGMSFDWQSSQAEDATLEDIQKKLEASKAMSGAASGPVVSGTDNYKVRNLRRSV